MSSDTIIGATVMRARARSNKDALESLGQNVERDMLNGACARSHTALMA